MARYQAPLQCRTQHEQQPSTTENYKRLSKSLSLEPKIHQNPIIPLPHHPSTWGWAGATGCTKLPQIIPSPFHVPYIHRTRHSHLRRSGPPNEVGGWRPCLGGARSGHIVNKTSETLKSVRTSRIDSAESACLFCVQGFLHRARGNWHPTSRLQPSPVQESRSMASDKRKMNGYEMICSDVFYLIYYSRTGHPELIPQQINKKPTNLNLRAQVDRPVDGMASKPLYQ